jgi:hypothetical protein
MRITIAHNKGRVRMIQMVDRAFDEVFKGVAQVPSPSPISRSHGKVR